MKKLLTLALFLIFSGTFAQNAAGEFDSQKWDPPYTLPVPQG